jgi:hypothetical protein
MLRARLVAAATVTSLLAAIVGPAAAGAAGAADTGSAAPTAARTGAAEASPQPATGVVPAGVADRYLSRRPSLGRATVVDISAQGPGGKVLAATLQGLVNRDVARMYLVGMRAPEEDRYWIDHYATEGLVEIEATVGLGEALDRFAAVATGFVVADEAEPWTLNTATSAAAAEGAVVATPDQIAVLQARGLSEIDDHRGRWPDAATAYEAIAATYRDRLAYPGLAIEQPDNHRPRDFFVQQGIMTVFTRPSRPDADRVYALLAGYPSDRPVYGYVADDGTEEVQAMVRLSQAGRFLVPTDTTDNLSFHVAVGATSPRVPQPRPSTSSTSATPCRTTEANVVLAFTDGDNQVIPLSSYLRSGMWPSARRGELPIGWSIGPGAAVLMPAVWDRYAESATAADELVSVSGLGYTLPSLHPDATRYYADSFSLEAALGLRTHWSLDALLSDPSAAGWATVAAAAATAGAGPDGLLLNYLDFGGPSPFHSPDGRPVLASRQVAYEDDVDDLVAQLTDLTRQPASTRPLVTFIAVTAWQTTYDQIVDRLASLRATGLRVLTPTEAAACLPAPTPAPPPAPSTTTPTTIVEPTPVASPIDTSPARRPAFTG